MNHFQTVKKKNLPMLPHIHPVAENIFSTEPTVIRCQFPRAATFQCPIHFTPSAMPTAAEIIFYPLRLEENRSHALPTRMRRAGDGSRIPMGVSASALRLKSLANTDHAHPMVASIAPASVGVPLLTPRHAIKRRKLPWFGLTSIVAMIAMGALTGCQRAEPGETAEAPKVDSDEVTFQTNSTQLASFAVTDAKKNPTATTKLFGRLTWNGDATANIFTPVSGRVLKIPAALNQKISAGDVLAEVDSPDYSQAFADARTAAGNFATAEKTLNREKELLAHGAAAQKDVESAEAAFTAANAERERAQQRLANYGGSLDGGGALYQLRSPLAGVLVVRNLSPGQELRADMMLANSPQFFTAPLVVTDPARLWLQLDVTENDLRRLQEGMAVVVRSASFPNEIFNGTVDSISQTLDPVTRTITVRGAVDNAAGKLKAEMLVTVELPADDAPQLQLPARAVYLRGSQHYVFVEEQPGKFRRREVELGAESADRVEIVHGLQPGERVVSEGVLLLEKLFE